MNYEQKIIGTWVTPKGTWVFNDNGTLTKNYNNIIDKSKFGVVDTKLAINSDTEWSDIYDISISSDGKTLILISNNGGNCYWLTKK